MKKNKFSSLIWLNLFTSAHCTIAHIALMMGLSYIFSNSIFIFSFFTGLYLMSMGLGTLFIERFTLDSKHLIQLIIINSLLGIILANPGVMGILFINEYLHLILRNYSLDMLPILFPLGIMLTILTGIVSGAELPIFSKLIEEENLETSRLIIRILMSDYFGAFLGIIIFSLLLNPFFGLVKAIIYAQIITVLFINWTGLKIKIFNGNKKLLAGICAINLFVLLSFILQNNLANLLNNISSF